jgi:glycosyltransferase involved in cell wall biosynthesis
LKVAVYTIALNEAAHAERWASSAADADYRIVADTGSTDDTVERLSKAGVTVHRIAVRPWRFDVARNAAMALIPADVDVCCSMDMDRFLEPGWRAKLEAAWTPETTALFCWVTYRSSADDPTPLRGWPAKNFHHRWGYRFRRPAHEALVFTGEKEVAGSCNDLVMCEVQDHSKGTRSQYLPLMELAHKEDSDDAQICFWLGRDYMWGNQHEQGSELLQRYLLLPTSTWTEERSEAMRYLARMQPEKKMAWLEKARIEAPHRREIWLDLAEELHGQSDWLNLFWACSNGIEKTYRTGSYLDDSHSWGFRLFDLGAIASWHLNAMDRAVEWGRKALELDPGDQRLKNNLDFFVRRQAEVRGGATPRDIFWNASFARRVELNEAICGHTRGMVVSGPFAGMKIANRSSWGDGEIAPKLLGTYEQELHEALLQFRARSYGAVVNVGCAEGYYAVGLARLNASWRVYAFDPNPTAQQLCQAAAQLNGVAERVIIGGYCSAEDLKLLSQKHGALLCVIDCEGYELELLTSAFIEQNGRSSDFIVECHDIMAPGTTEGLQNRFRDTHEIKLIKPGARDPNKFDFLGSCNDMERWLAVAEMRWSTGHWLVCEARAKTG